jgi:hypothetical protein
VGFCAGTITGSVGDAAAAAPVGESAHSVVARTTLSAAMADSQGRDGRCALRDRW